MDKVREEFEKFAKSEAKDNEVRELKSCMEDYLIDLEAANNEIERLESLVYHVDQRNDSGEGLTITYKDIFDSAGPRLCDVKEIQLLKKQIKDSIELIDTFHGLPHSAGDLTQLITEVMATLTKDGE